MGEYTTIHFIPLDLKWCPTKEIVRDLMDYFGAKVASVSRYSEAELWDAEDPPRQTFRADRISAKQALRQVFVPSRVAAMLMLENLEWSRPLCDSLVATIPPKVADSYVPWDVHMWIGRRTIPDPLGERFAAETNFDLTISGNGMPTDLELYLSLLARTPQIVDLLWKLTGITGKSWRTLITASY